MELARSQRNGMVEAIQESPFSVEDFIREEGDTAISLRHEPTKSELVVNYGSFQDFTVSSHVVGDPVREEEAASLGIAVADWLMRLAQAAREPDLWSQIPDGAGLRSLTGEGDNSAFTDDELALVRTWADQVRKRAEIDGTHTPLLEEKLAYVVQAAPRVGRIDWLNLTIGAFMGAFAGGILTPDVVHTSLTLLVSVAGHLFAHGAPLLPPAP